MTTDAHTRLAVAVRERRAELGLAQGDLKAAGGPSTVTVGQIEREQLESPQARTLHGLDVALQWPAGTAAGIFRGTVTRPVPSEPRPAEGGPVAEIIDAIRRNTALRPEAKAHLANQVELLLMISGPASDAVLREQEQRRQDAEVQGQGVAALRAVSGLAEQKSPKKRSPKRPGAGLR